MEVVFLTAAKQEYKGSPQGGSECVSPATELQALREAAIQAIRTETGCSIRHARVTLDWINNFVVRARMADYRHQYPTDDQMCTPQYRTFDAVIPHGQSSQPGSAHEAIEKAVLDPNRDEFSLLHDQRDDIGSPRYCTVQVCLGVLRTS
jgi:hypothetical protein